MIIFEADYPDKCNYDLIKYRLSRSGFIKIEEGHQNVWLKSIKPKISKMVMRLL
jgi:hypothetical protein